MLSQFDLGNALRCPAVDDEGYRCGKPPSHDGGHVWSRCGFRDADGHHCSLPPRHAGGHEPPWYDRPARESDSHTIRYDGSGPATMALADRAAAIAARHGWIEASRAFKPGPRWPWLALMPLLGLSDKPSGRLTVVFAYRPEPTAGKRRST